MKTTAFGAVGWILCLGRVGCFIPEREEGFGKKKREKEEGERSEWGKKRTKEEEGNLLRGRGG